MNRNNAGGEQMDSIKRKSTEEQFQGRAKQRRFEDHDNPDEISWQQLEEKDDQVQRSRIKLNVGGIRYETSKSTLSQYPGTMLESVVSGRQANTTDNEGYIFIDRDGEIFRHILNSMRVERLVLPQGFVDFDMLAQEIDYYGLPFHLSTLSDFTRKEVVEFLVDMENRVISFVGFRLCGLDLSFFSFVRNVKLAKVDFPNANLSGVNFGGVDLNGCTFDNANLTNANLNDCNLKNAVFHNAILTQSSFRHALCNSASFVDCQADGADFTKVNFAAGEFTNVQCKDAIFQFADFFQCNVAATDFSQADLTGVINKQ